MWCHNAKKWVWSHSEHTKAMGCLLWVFGWEKNKQTRLRWYGTIFIKYSLTSSARRQSWHSAIDQHIVLYCIICWDITKDHSVYVPSQWEMALHCKAISHWLGAYTEWSLHHRKCPMETCCLWASFCYNPPDSHHNSIIYKIHHKYHPHANSKHVGVE